MKTKNNKKLRVHQVKEGDGMNMKRFLEKAGLVIILISLFEGIIIEINNKTDINSIIIISVLFCTGFIMYLVSNNNHKVKT